MSEKKYKSPLYVLFRIIKKFRQNEKHYLLGRVKTIIDGAISDSTQNKAVKDLVETAFWQENYHFAGLAEALEQFKRKYCSGIENGYKITVASERNYPENDQNYFPEDDK